MTFPRIRAFLAAAWRPVRETARKLVPSRGARWTFLYVPAFTAALIFALQAFGLVDLRDYVLEVGARSAPLLICVALTFLVSTLLGWNLDNDKRAKWQDRLAEESPVVGALLVLAGEFVAIFGLLYLFLDVLLRWQG